MFAVPGWAVSSSALKSQTEPAASKPQNEPQPTKETLKSKKRKRGNDNVTKANVDEMYRRLIEAKDNKSKADNKNGAAKSVKTEKKRKKEGKLHDDSSAKGGKAEEEEQQCNGTTEGGPSDGADTTNKDKGNKKQKNKNKKKQQQQSQDDANPTSNEVPTSTTTTESLPPAAPSLTPLQQAMRQKLISARFRHLNETLYTTDSSKAMELFSSNPELFNEYHAGFSHQVKESWPSNPVDGYIQSVRTRGQISPVPKKSNNGKNHSQQTRPLPRRPNGLCTIADLGCGDARLARTLTPSAKKLNLKLLSYDLQAPDPVITKADIANLPIPDGSVDVAIFCLSLMGTNWVSFVEEAWRVLRSDGKGECWVSEVKSRFGKVVRKKAQIGAKKLLSKAEKKKLSKKKRDDDDAGSDVDDAEVYAEDARPSDNDETDISAFVDVFRSRGFVLKPESVDKSNKMFVKMEFVKQGGPPSKGKYASVTGGKVAPGKKKFIEKTAETGYSLSPEEEAKVLKPCVYKIR